jgi:hypothetical protein
VYLRKIYILRKHFLILKSLFDLEPVRSEKNYKSVHTARRLGWPFVGKHFSVKNWVKLENGRIPSFWIGAQIKQ